MVVEIADRFQVTFEECLLPMIFSSPPASRPAKNEFSAIQSIFGIDP